MHCAVLFSGGSDSTLAAALAAERFPSGQVHLLTMNRRGFYRAEKETEANFANLQRVYGAHRFVRKIVEVEALHRELCETARGDRLLRVSLSFAKLSLHGAALEYCLEHKITTLYDGAVPYMYLYPDQARIGGRLYRNFHRRFGVSYESPVNGISRDVEALLFARGITPQPEMRGTSRDHQVFYAEQILFALWIRYSVARHGYRKHRERLRDLYAERLEVLCEKYAKIHHLAQRTP